MHTDHMSNKARMVIINLDNVELNRPEFPSRVMDHLHNSNSIMFYSICIILESDIRGVSVPSLGPLDAAVQETFLHTS